MKSNWKENEYWGHTDSLMGRGKKMNKWKVIEKKMNIEDTQKVWWGEEKKWINEEKLKRKWILRTHRKFDGERKKNE